MFVLCTLLGGEFRENLETSESGWFSLNELPELDLEKTTPEQLRMCFEPAGRSTGRPDSSEVHATKGRSDMRVISGSAAGGG